MNVYLESTRDFNRGRLRAVISSGQAVVLHRLAIMSNEERLRRYADAAEAWAGAWPRVEKEIAGLPLPEAHARVLQRAEDLLPFRVEKT